MKDFIKKFFAQAAIQWLLMIFLIPVSVVWSTAWTIQDGSFNYEPLLWCGGFFVFVFLMSWFFRNNP